MTLKSDTKFKEKLFCCFKNDTRNYVNFHPTTHFHPKSLKVSWRWALLAQSIQGLTYKKSEELSFMALNRYAKFE